MLPEGVDLLPAADAQDAWDQSTTYGRMFAGVYDELFPSDADAQRTAEVLHELAGPGCRALELGVGTGRVAVPLARRGTDVTGVDSSRELLHLAARTGSQAEVELELVRADLRTWDSTERYDLVFCVCATISMFASREEQARVLAVAARALRPSARLVVETHSPARVQALHVREDTVLFSTDVPGLPGGLLSRSHVRRGTSRWSLEHVWWSDGERHRAEEHSLLTPPHVLDDLARAVGLRPVCRWSDWLGSPADPLSPTYVSVYARPR